MANPPVPLGARPGMRARFHAKARSTHQTKARSTRHAKARSTRLFALALLGVLLVSRSYWGAAGSVAVVSLLLGVTLAGLAMAGRLWTSVYHAGYKNRSLLTRGPYSLCRNPMYFFNFLGGLGVGLATGTLTIPLLFAAIFTVYYPCVIRGEERNLGRRHGAAFDRYRARTPAFLPSWSHLDEPEQYVVNIRLLRTKLIDSFAPLAGLAVVVAIRMLHLDGALPALFRLY